MPGIVLVAGDRAGGSVELQGAWRETKLISDFGKCCEGSKCVDMKESNQEDSLWIGWPQKASLKRWCLNWDLTD